MKRIPLATAILLLSIATFASAQGPSLRRSSGPTISPYLNLLNNRGSLASNYYNLYRTQRDFERFERQAVDTARQLRSSINDQKSQLNDLQLRNSGLTPTGSGASFMTHGRYFGASRR